MQKTKKEIACDNLLQAAKRFQRENPGVSLVEAVQILSTVSQTWESEADRVKQHNALVESQRQAEEKRIKREQAARDERIAARQAGVPIAPPLKTAPDAVVPNGQPGRTARTGIFIADKTPLQKFREQKPVRDNRPMQQKLNTLKKLVFGIK